MSVLVSDILPLGCMIMMGDFNADMLRPKLAPGKSLKALLSLANVKTGGTAPTRITSTSATCLDLIAIDKSILCIQYGVDTLSVSDHLPAVASVTLKGR